jgi:hypothetical protein
VFALNQLGTVQGIVMGWLLDQVGFLFDWDDIKANKNALKSVMNETISNLGSIVDLSAAERQAETAIEQFKSEVKDYFQSFTGSPEAHYSATSALRSAPSPQKLVNANGSPGDWLSEKLSDLLSNIAISGLQNVLIGYIRDCSGDNLL